MALANEQIAEIQTLAELLGVQPIPSSASIKLLYDKHLSRLSASEEPIDQNAERDRNRTMAKRLENFKQNR